MNTTTNRSKTLLVAFLGCGCAGALLVTCLALLIVLLITGGVLWSGASVWRDIENWDPEEESWTLAVIPLPDYDGDVAFQRRLAHPIMAEYYRKLRIRPAGQPPQTLEMPMNVGGRTLINVYWIAAGLDGHPTLQMIDHWGMYVVDLAAADPEVVQLHRQDGEWWMSSSSPEETEAFLESLSDADYVGRIDGTEGPMRFISADEAPEVPIDFVGED